MISLYFSSHLTAQSAFRCPQPDGTFEDAEQCDMYHECYDGVATTLLCPDGLVFDPFSRRANPCDHYFNIACENRVKLRKCPLQIHSFKVTGRSKSGHRSDF